MTTTYCANCGAGIDPGGKFCPQCGQGAGGAIPQRLPRSNQTKGQGKDPALFEYFQECLKKYATFQGRARRKEYWSFALYYNVFYIGIIIFYFFTMKLHVDDLEYSVISILAILPIICLFFLTQGGKKPFGKHWWAWFLALFPFTLFLSICVYYPIFDTRINHHLPIHLFFYILFMSLPNLAVFARRCHDIGRSGWNFLWFLIPSVLIGISQILFINGKKEGALACLLPALVIGFILMAVFLIEDSDAGDNEFGPNPKGLR